MSQMDRARVLPFRKAAGAMIEKGTAWGPNNFWLFLFSNCLLIFRLFVVHM